MVVKTLPIPSEKIPIIHSSGTSRPLLHSQSVSFPTNNRSDQQQQHRLPDASDLRRMCIITKSDLNRIYDNLDRRQRDKDAVRQEIERRKEMAERSAQVTKHWTNTILGARERKLELKKIREDEEEERRKVIDIEEEKLAAERRREQIEKAKQMQYYETDRVRTFHSSLILSEVLKERDAQIEMKKKIEQLRQSDDAEERQRYLEAQNDFYKSEKEKFENRLKERANLTKYHRAQMEERKTRLAEEKRKDEQEGAEYKRLAQQLAMENMELEHFRKLNQKEVRSMYDQAVEDKKKVKEIEEKMDEDEDDQLRVYADAKKKITRLRREKELAIQREKQEAQDQMTGYLGSLQKRAEADFDTQILRAQALKQAKELREEKEKYEKQQKMFESIRKHRMETMKRREAEREIEERDEMEMQRKKAEADQLYYLYQEEKDRQRHQGAQAISESYLKQAQERKERQRAMRANEYEEVQQDRHISEVERQQYKDYTDRVIGYMEENGRNTYPLKRAVADEMKRFDFVLQNSKKGESPQTTGEKKADNQDKSNLDETKKHLGFQWTQPNK